MLEKGETTERTKGRQRQIEGKLATDRHTHTQIDRHTEGRIDRHTHTHTERQTDRKTDKQKDK